MAGTPEFISLDIDALLASIDTQVNVIAPDLNEVLALEDALDVAEEAVANTVEVVLVPESVEPGSAPVQVEPAPEAVTPQSAPLQQKSTPAEKPSKPASRARYFSDTHEPRSRKNIDPEELDIIRLYMTDIGQYPLLTKDDEVRLARQIEVGIKARQQKEAAEMAGLSLPPTERRLIRRSIMEGDDAAEQFTQANLRLVVSIAKRYQASGLPLMDLIQEGNLGLMHAVEKFDWQKGFKFSTYATWWIRQSITRGIANTNSMIRLPVHAGNSVNRLKKVRSRLQLAGLSTNVDSLADELGVSPDDVKALLDMESRLTLASLNRPLNDELGSVELGDVVADVRSTDEYNRADVETDLVDQISQMLTHLTERERTILSHRYGLNGEDRMTLGEIGASMRITRERIRQIESRALSKLRHPALAGRYRELIHYLNSEAS